MEFNFTKQELKDFYNKTKEEIMQDIEAEEKQTGKRSQKRIFLTDFGMKYYTTKDQAAVINAQKAVKQILKELAKTDVYAKKLLAGLEAETFEINASLYADNEKLLAASCMNLKKDKTTERDYTMMGKCEIQINKIYKDAKKQHQKLEATKIEGVELGETLNKYQAIARSILNEVINGVSPEVAVQNELSKNAGLSA